MPNRDGTGPYGEQNWQCRRLQGRGMGFRAGFGRGFGYARQGRQAEQQISLTKEEQAKVLEAELVTLEAEKKAIEEKLKGLK